MVASAALRERGFAEVKRLCYGGLDAATLLRSVATRLKRVVPFEAYCAQTNDPLSGLLTHVINDGAILGEKEHRTYVEQVYFEQDLDEQRRLVQNRLPVVRLSDATGGKLERALRFREITGPLGLGYELFGVCAVGRQQWGGICLIRERRRPDFDSREMALLRRLTPHVGAALQAAALRMQVSAQPERDGVPGVLVIDSRGRVVQHTETAEHWLRDLGHLGSGWLEGRGLPDAIWMVVGALRRTFAPETDRDLSSVPCVRVQTRAGRWLTFHGARTEAQAGREGETMVIIEPARPRELAWFLGSAYGLSERERVVADRVAQGDSTEEIAQALHISKYTVQEHLSNAFDKIGIHSRRALVQRLFFDNLYPALSSSAEDRTRA